MACEDVAPKTSTVLANGSSSFASGFRLSTASIAALDKAFNSAKASLDRAADAAKAKLCAGLCPEGCTCSASVELEAGTFQALLDLLGDSPGGPQIAHYAPASTWLGFGWGGTWTVDLEADVTVRCVPG